MTTAGENDPRVPELVEQPDGTFKYEGGTDLEEEVTWELAACRHYAETGSITETARHFHKTHYQIKKLMATAWWQDEVSRVRQEAVVKADAGYSKLLDLSIEQLLDRVVKGEITGVKENKVTGVVEEKRVPLKVLDLVRINDLAFMKRALIRNEPTDIQGGTQSLTVLAQKLRALGAKDPSIIDLPMQEVRSEGTGSCRDGGDTDA